MKQTRKHAVIFRRNIFIMSGIDAYAKFDCCYWSYHKLCTPHITKANAAVLKLSVLATLLGHTAHQN